MSIPITGYAHVRLTVTDIARSRKFYDDVLGLPVAFELPADADEATKEQLWFLFGGVIYQVPGGSLLGLRPVAPAEDAFNENRTGLDHVCFSVASRAVLDATAAKLDDLGVTHEPVKDIGLGFLLEFRDPDGIALELMAPAE
jgi:glyoxylase I family protein